MSPAPWYWLSLLVVAIVAAPGVRKQNPKIGPESIADRTVPDSPLSEQDFDALGLKEIAAGLSRFFRNVNTKPPLTVTIIADWGYGKTSLMRLLEADLRRNRVRPVWFNAWHHQTEDHLLAYLLEAIREQAVPSLLALTGLRFRLRLLWIRGPRHCIANCVFACLVGFGIELLRSPGALADWNAWIEPGVTAAALLGGLFGLAKPLKVFGTTPAALLKAVGASTRIQSLEAKTSFRMAFERQFRDVTKALSPHQMVIFIDDLDRCPPDRVLQILESVNFLVSAGDCFVVLGLAKEVVMASVGLAFDKIAAETVAEENGSIGSDADARARAKRREYARNYLKKLINLEVAIPRPTDAQAQSLLTGVGESSPEPPAVSLFRWMRHQVFGLAGVLLLVAAFGGCFAARRFTPIIQAWVAESAQAKQASVVKAPQQAVTIAAEPPPPLAVNGSGTERSQSSVFVRPGAPPSVRNWWYWIFAAAVHATSRFCGLDAFEAARHGDQRLAPIQRGP